MSDTPNNPQPGPDDAFDLATLIRCAADDNLSMAQAQALGKHLEAHPEDRARIDFERGLRDAVSAAMDTGPAPAHLRQAIESFIADSRTPDTVGPRTTRDRSFWSRSFLPIALAAMVLMAFGVTLMVSNQPAASTWNTGLSRNVTNWIQTEHKKCCESKEYREGKLNVTNVADVHEQTLRDLGAAPRRIQLDDAGYTFAGYGQCHIPGGGPSGQLIYMSNDGAGKPISLFVQRDDGQLNDVASKTDCLTNDQIFIWRADGLIYYLVSGPKSPTGEALKTLGAPSKQISL